MENIWYSGQATLSPLFVNAVFSLVLLFSVNLLLRRTSAAAALRRTELLTIYAMLCVASSVAGRHFLPALVHIIPAVFWFATPENEWAQMLHPYVPKWLAIEDPRARPGFYTGEATFYTPAQLAAWVPPALLWTLFIFALLTVMLCLCILVRKQWTEEEKLAYPIVRLPLAITAEGTGFYRNNLLWIGFAIAAGIDTLNGLHVLFPAVPYLHVKWTDIGHVLTEKPWNAVGWLVLSFFPFVIGMSFFLPLDMAFSLVFFFFARKGAQVAASALGTSVATGWSTGPVFDGQAQGAWLGFALLTVWGTRKHFRRVFNQARRPRSGVGGNDGATYRWALAGMGISLMFLGWFSAAAGMSLWAIVLLYGTNFAIFLALTRARAELAPPHHNMWGVNARAIMVNVFGSRGLGARNLTVMGFFHFFNRNYPSHPMPEYMESLKIGERASIRSRSLTGAMLLATAVAIPISFWIYLHLIYASKTHATYAGLESFRNVARQLSFPSGANPQAVLAMAFGFLGAIALMLMRMRFLWWPFHPAGYAFSINFGIDFIWTCILISAVAKWLILKAGGLRAHQKAVPFFMGLILGEFVVGSFWSALGIVLQVPTYTFSIH